MFGPASTTPRAMPAPRPVPAVRRSARRLGVLLELLERRDLSPTELRILLAVGQREAHGLAALKPLITASDVRREVR